MTEGWIFPASFAQQRMWFLDQLEPGSSLYNVPVAMRVEGPLNVAALERCLNELARRHESLRTSFATVDGSAVCLKHLFWLIFPESLKKLKSTVSRYEYRQSLLYPGNHIACINRKKVCKEFS